MAISDGDRHDAYLRRIRPPVFPIDGAVAMLRRRAAFIAGVTLACVTVSLLYILLAPPRYLASGRMELGASVTDDVAATRIKDITSPRVFNNVIAREKLETDPLFGARSRGILSALSNGIGLVPAADPHALALRRLDRAVSVTHESDSSTVNVNAVTADREISARVANAVMEFYIEDMSRLRTETTPGVGAPPDISLEMFQGRLRDAEQRYDKYRQDNGIAGSDGQPVIEKPVSELTSQIAAAEARVNSWRSTLTQLQRAKEDRDVDAIPAALRSRAVDVLRNRYATARRIEADLSDTLGPRHPDLRFARSQASEARRLLDQAIGDMVQSTAGELERARSAAVRLKARLEASKKGLTRSNEVFARLRELERDVETNRAAYQAFLLRSRVAGERRQLSDTLPLIVSRATPPQGRSGASSIRVLLISILLGLGFAISLAWLLELMGERKSKTAFR
jgi:uncharacterized protein involved in exopolysaccharide biosynthesis